MGDRDIEDLFAKASRLDDSKYGYLTEGQWKTLRIRDGARRFKRRVLGLCGRETVKTLEEMANLLHETGIVSSVEEGKKLMPSLVGESVAYTYYADSVLLGRELGFEVITNSEGQKAYRVLTFFSDYA